MNAKFIKFLNDLSAATNSPLVESVKEAYILCEESDLTDIGGLPADFNEAKAMGEEKGASHVEPVVAEGIGTNAALGAIAGTMIGCAGAPQFIHMDVNNPDHVQQLQELSYSYDIPDGATAQDINKLADDCIGQISAELNSQKGNSDDDFNPSHTAGWSQAIVIYDLLVNGDIKTNDPHYTQQRLADQFAAKMSRLHEAFLETPDFLDSYRDEKSRSELSPNANDDQSSTYTVKPNDAASLKLEQDENDKG